MFKQLKKKIWLMSVFGMIQLSVFAQIKMNMGNNLQFRYDLQKGTFGIYQQQEALLQEVYSSFQLQGDQEMRVQGVKPSYKRQEFRDAAGSGIQYRIDHKLPNNLRVVQNFYFYKGASYLVMDMELHGPKLSSNSLSPLNWKGQALFSGKAITAVSVPFDNDTFISYSKKPLSKAGYKSAEVGILYDEQTGTGLISSSLDQSTWKTGIMASLDAADQTNFQLKNGFTETSLTRDSMDHGYLQADIIKSSKIYIDYTKDWQDGLDQMAKFQRKLYPVYYKVWQEGTPIGWNSWGVIQEKLNFENATAAVDYFKQQIPAFRNEQGKAYLDLDSFWDNMVAGGMSGDYSKLKEFVAYCQAAGLEPGVYWAPFTDWGFGSGPNRQAEGSTYTFGEMWTKTKTGYHDLDGGRALDPTHPGTQARMKYILEKLKDCGFRMIKIDFLSHGAIESTSFYDKQIHTGMQAYAVGMKKLNDLLDQQMLIYAAISPSLATYRYAHMRRIACDAWKTIDQSKYTLNSLSFGWWQTYLYDFIDADHLVFHDEPKNSTIVRYLSGIVTGTIILGDDFSKPAAWQEWMNPILQNPNLLQIVKDGKSFRPLASSANQQTSNYYLKKLGTDYYFVAFNFEKQAQALQFDLKPYGLNKAKYQVTELIQNKQQQTDALLSLNLEPESAQIFKISPL